MGKDRKELDPWVLKFEEFTSDESISLTLQNLSFPQLEDPEQIKTFFLALESSDYNTSCRRLGQIICKNKIQTKLVLSVLKNAIDSQKWGSIDESKNSRNRNKTLER
jgi:hypothetical protein